MNNFDISSIETSVKAMIQSWKITKKVYNNRPKAEVPISDFIVVRVSGSVSDEFAYGECTLSVSLFVRDADNEKNSKKLSYLYSEFIRNMPPAYENGNLSYLFDTCPTVIGDTPDDYGFHARIINIRTIIKVI